MKKVFCVTKCSYLDQVKKHYVLINSDLNSVSIPESILINNHYRISAEFLLLDKEGKKLGDWKDTQQPMSLQEPLAVMRTAPVLQKILDYMEQLGWEPYEVF